MVDAIFTPPTQLRKMGTRRTITFDARHVSVKPGQLAAVMPVAMVTALA